MTPIAAPQPGRRWSTRLPRSTPLPGCATCAASTTISTSVSPAAVMALPPEERRTLLRAYLGFPYFDIATLPLLQGEGLDEYDPIKVDPHLARGRDLDPLRRRGGDLARHRVQQLRRLLQPRLSARTTICGGGFMAPSG